MRTHLPELLRLAAEALREPAFPRDRVREAEARTPDASLEEQRTDPQSIAERALCSAGTIPIRKGDVRYVPTFDEELAEIKGAKLDQVKAFLRALRRRRECRARASSAISIPPPMKTLVTELFGAWKSPSPFARVPESVPAAGADGADGADARQGERRDVRARAGQDQRSRATTCRR